MGPELDQLCRFLDALRRRFDVERVGELGDRADNRARAVAGEQVLDEAPVDFQFVEREALQVAQRRIASAEIVQGNPDAERAQRMQQLERRIAALEEDRLGDLDLQAIGFEAAVGERVQYGFVERAAVELHRRRVNCDANVVGPARGPVARFPHNPGADGNDEAGVLRDRHELVGRPNPRVG